MSLKRNSESNSDDENSMPDQNIWRTENEEESELTIIYDLDLDLDDCYLLGLPKFTENVFEEMKLLEDLDLEFEDLFLLGGLPKVEIIYDDLDGEGAGVLDNPKQEEARSMSAVLNKMLRKLARVDINSISRED